MKKLPFRLLALATLALALPACWDETVGSPALIGLSDDALGFAADEGGADPADQVVTLTNIGARSSVLDWTASSDRPWLSVVPASGSLGTSGSAPLTVTVNTALETEAWTGATSVAGAPAVGTGRAVWTGSAMLVWGDNLSQDGTFYDPVLDAWSGATSTAGAPAGRTLFSTVWTGTEMIVWGGLTMWGGTPLNSGGRYNPATDTWAPMSTAGAPSARFAHSAVWTGSRMLVWGGDVGGFGYRADGALYDPVTDTWTGATASAGAPSARGYHAAVWTGTRMIVWGGENPGKLGTGALYDPTANAWTGTTSTTDAPSARSHMPAVWTGTEMIVWGGGAGGPHLDTGGRYNPVLNKWTGATTTASAPAGRASHSLVWTGTRTITWGGEINGVSTGTGGVYRPPSLAEGVHLGTITIGSTDGLDRIIFVTVTVGP